jgi:hypothetical protein
MKNSKFEIRNSKGMSRGFRESGVDKSPIPTMRALRVQYFEFLISNFEFRT